MTETEIIAYLGKTSLPTLLVEGTGDAAIYRWLESRLGTFSGNVLPCSGRETLLSIYRQRESFSHGRLVWIADLDLWQFSAPPPDVGGVIFTTGYSIENDLYAGSDIESLLSDAERSRHSQTLAAVCRWFAFEALEFLAGREARVATHIRRLLDDSALELSAEFIRSRGFSEPDPKFVAELLANYKLRLRGKSLLETLLTYLSDSHRTPKYSSAAVIEMCLKLFPKNPYVTRLIDEARQQLET